MKKKSVKLTAAEVEGINEALAKLDADVEAYAKEAAALDAKERAKPVEKSDRWWGAYYRLENEFIHELHMALEKEEKTQADLARLLGVSRARVSQIFNGGEENFKLETIAKVATALDRDVAIRLIKKTEQVLVTEVMPTHFLPGVHVQFSRTIFGRESERRQTDLFSAYNMQTKPAPEISTPCKVIDITKAA